MGLGFNIAIWSDSKFLIVSMTGIWPLIRRAAAITLRKPTKSQTPVGSKSICIFMHTDRQAHIRWLKTQPAPQQAARLVHVGQNYGA